MMRAEEESSILRDVASSEKDMEYFEDCIGLPLYMNAESNFTLSGTRVEFLLNGTM